MKHKIRSEKLKNAISDIDEFRLFQYLVYKFETTALKVTDVIADKLSQSFIALVLSMIIQLLAILDLRSISTIELTMRTMILSITIVCMRIVKRLINLKIEKLNLVVSSMINVVVIATLLNLISSLKIYHFLIFKILLAFAALFWIASLINRGSDMYLDDEK